MLIRFIVACYSTDLRSVLLSTSIGNNAWFVFSSNAGELVLLSFTLIYAISLLGSLSSTIPVRSLFLANLRGLPPFPIFFIKLFVLTSSIAVLGVSRFVL
jgi:hypothetical protein